MKDLDAVIFDMDGVIVDSEPLKFQAYQRVFRRRFQVDIAVDDPSWHGVGEAVAVATFARLTGVRVDDPQAVIADKRAAYLERLADEGVPYREGAVALIESLAARGMPLGLATGSDREQLGAVLAPRRLERHFAALVCRDDVSRGKPDPEIFLLTARRLDCSPERCLVIEDTRAGVTAARAAGMHCIALTGTQDRQSLADADQIVDHLDRVAELLHVGGLLSGDRSSRGGVRGGPPPAVSPP